MTTNPKHSRPAKRVLITLLLGATAVAFLCSGPDTVDPPEEPGFMAMVPVTPEFQRLRQQPMFRMVRKAKEERDKALAEELKGPYGDIIEREIARVTTPRKSVGYHLDGLRDGVGKITDPAIAELFPGWVFYSMSYTMFAQPGYEGKVSIAGGLGHTFAVPPDGGDVMRFGHHGNYREYGDLLAKTGVVLRDEADARLVLKAFCKIHHSGSWTAPIEQVSPTEWKLGIYRSDQTIAHENGRNVIVTRT